MLRPEAFQQPHVAVQNLPYSVAGDGASLETFSVGGVLSRGCVVWTREAFAMHSAPPSTLAFVEELGVVSLDPRWLARTDMQAIAQSLPGYSLNEN